MPTAEAYESACHQIKQAHDTLGHKLGWQFLTSPKNTFHPKVDIGFFTLLPLTEYHCEQTYSASAEQGSIFATEQWGNHAVGRAPLQKQVQAMFRQFSRLFYCSGDALLQRSLTAHLIPFRAESIEKLQAADDSKQFAQDLWQKLLPELEAKLVICIDDYSSQVLYQLLTNGQIKQAKPDTIKLNWGNVSAKVYRLPEGSPSRALIRLPQLARFTVFDREKSQSAINELIALLHTVLNEQPQPTAAKKEAPPSKKKQQAAFSKADKEESVPSVETAAPAETSAKSKTSKAISDTTKAATTKPESGKETDKPDPKSEEQPEAVAESQTSEDGQAKNSEHRAIIDSSNAQPEVSKSPEIPHNQDGMEDEIQLTQRSQVLPSEGASHLADQISSKSDIAADGSADDKTEKTSASQTTTTEKESESDQAEAAKEAVAESKELDAPSPAIAARLEQPFESDKKINKPEFSEKELYADEPVSKSSLIVTALEVVIFTTAAAVMIAYVLR
ncbi:hypothetical protein ACFSJ3_18550 [Corallincola platygyrae]|uniref:Uncharacterized protein n=1 Tax=Corallincola platygyrae TaxID=1193278 RepID=A0ABW4XT14_9GAMM